MAQVDDSPSPLHVLIEDSPDARLFIELSSHAADLTEARRALDLAMQGNEVKSPFAEASPYLMGFAVVAYCRTTLHSNVRRSLRDHVPIPDDLLDTHEQVRIFRNATIAHSQSELAVTYPIGRLDPRTREVDFVSAVTMTNPLPTTVARRFDALIETMIDLLDEAIDPIRARLEDGLRRADPDVLLAGPRPKVFERSAEEFDARSTRNPYPTRQTMYWDLAVEGDE